MQISTAKVPRSLNEIGIKYNTDKSSEHHDYCKVYEQYLTPIRNASFTLLELGIGGYEFPEKGGNSARMWREWLPNARIITTDNRPKSFTIPGVEILQLSQTETFIPADVIIDDASHHNELTIESFKNLWPLLSKGGLYFIEDVHTSYWVDYYKGNPVPGEGVTTMNCFTALCHQLNAEALREEYKSEYVGQIEYIHFYPKLIIVKKC